MSQMDDLGWWQRVAGANGKGFRYLKVDGTPLTSEAGLKRIASLAIPPAWTDVWICPRSDVQEFQVTPWFPRSCILCPKVT